MESNPYQVHRIKLQVEGFLTYLLSLCPVVGFWLLFDLAKHLAIPFTASVSFLGLVLAFWSMSFGKLEHVSILA
jgi:hypothetical protein